MSREKLKSLGRGLSSLLGEEPEETGTDAVGNSGRSVPVEFLRPGKFQPRRHFDEESIAGLVESIRQQGILQPILVRPDADDPEGYEIIAGERRWRAAQQAGLHEVPVIVRELGDRAALEVALVENLQRQDLSPLEEAEGYRRLMEDFEHTQEDLARAVGKSRSHVANMMRLLSLDEPVKDMLDRGELSAGHARALLGCDDAVKMARQVVTRGLNVRQTERLAQGDGGKKARAGKPPTKDADTAALERDLANLLGLKVAIQFTGRGGNLTIYYDTLEQLDDILHRLNHASGPAVAMMHGPNDEAPLLADFDLDEELGLDRLPAPVEVE
ncbi:MAG: ParB/RepB/Spo0J family partition protein [Alphaproteobacteria bacterium]